MTRRYAPFPRAGGYGHKRGRARLRHLLTVFGPPVNGLHPYGGQRVHAIDDGAGAGCGSAAGLTAAPSSSRPHATGAATSAVSGAPTRSTWPTTGFASAGLSRARSPAAPPPGRQCLRPGCPDRSGGPSRSPRPGAATRGRAARSREPAGRRRPAGPAPPRRRPPPGAAGPSATGRGGNPARVRRRPVLGGLGGTGTRDGGTGSSGEDQIIIGQLEAAGPPGGQGLDRLLLEFSRALRPRHVPHRPPGGGHGGERVGG